MGFALPDALAEIKESLGRIEQQTEVKDRLARLEAQVGALVGQKVVKAMYSTAEIAERAGRSEYQVRDWCRTGRLAAVKRGSGRGIHKEWMVSHEELTRYLSHGLRDAAV